MILISLLLLFLYSITASAATLETVGAYPCSGDKSVINVSNFTFSFDEASNNVTYAVQAFSTEQVRVLGKTFLIKFY